MKHAQSVIDVLTRYETASADPGLQENTSATAIVSKKRQFLSTAWGEMSCESARLSARSYGAGRHKRENP